MRSELVLAAVLALSMLGGCGASFRRFPLSEPMWADDDMRPFPSERNEEGDLVRPEEYYSPLLWDGADHMVFRPIAQFFAVRPGGRAVNINAFDEVPDSSWFTNRLGRQEISPARLVQASCEGPAFDQAGPITVTKAKPNGANPGFFVRDSNGNTFLLKFDKNDQPERQSTGDVLGSILFWGAGYYAPCNRIIYFDRSQLQIGEGAEVEDVRGNDSPLTMEHVDATLEFGEESRLSDGRYRACASQFLPGEPIGPWRYFGTRDDDPNDVVPHEDRREVRGVYVLSSWLNHFDAREQNTLAMWIETNEESGHGYIRHNMIDFGDSMGSLWPSDAVSRRLGHAYFLDVPYMVEDFFTLGLIRRPWERNHWGPAGRVLGYYDVENFEPDMWRAEYPNPAFGRLTEGDAAWATRILAEVTDAHLQAITNIFNVQNPVVQREMTRTLFGRRDRLYQRWLTRLSPLAHPRLEPTAEGARLCLRDLAVFTRVWSQAERRYRTRAWAHDGALEPLPAGPPPVLTGDHGVCIELPAAPGASSSSPGYLVVDVRGEQEEGPLRVHLYHLGGADYRVVGLERPDDDDPPG